MTPLPVNFPIRIRIVNWVRMPHMRRRTGLDEVLPLDSPVPEAVVLRYPAPAIAWRVTLALLLAVGATLLLAAFLQVPLMQASERIGATPLLVVWLLLLALFGSWVWWQSASFVLQADAIGIHRRAGWESKVVKWPEVAAAEAIESPGTAGRETTEGLYVVLRNSSGEKLMSLGFDISRGLTPDEVTGFKKLVRAQINAHKIPKEGPPLAWINWG
jgi:hypothetical protein